MDIGNIIRENRKEKGWSMEALARKANVSYYTILNIENGKHLPSFGVISEVLNALDLEMKVVKKED